MNLVEWDVSISVRGVVSLALIMVALALLIKMSLLMIRSVSLHNLSSFGSAFDILS